MKIDQVILPEPTLLRRATMEARNIVSLAVPIIIGMVSGVLMVMIDTAMIAPLGADVVAAAALATSAFIFINSALIGFTSVIGVNIAQAVGGEDNNAARIAIITGTIVTIGIGLTLALAMLFAKPLFARTSPSEIVLELLWPYWVILATAMVPHALLMLLRGVYNAIDRSWYALGFTLLGVLINVPLNEIFIFGAFGFEGAGLVGAGIASAMAKCIALVAILAHFQLSDSLKIYRRCFKFSRKDIKKLLVQGTPVAIGSVGEGGAYSATGMLVATLGTTALAAHQVVHSVGVVFYMVPIGLMIAVSIRTGYAVGSKQVERLIPLWVAGLSVVFFWSALTLLFVRNYSEQIGMSLSPDESVLHLAGPMFLAMVFIQFADGLQSISLGALRGLSDNLIPNLITVSIYWGGALPIAYVCGVTLGFGAFGVLVGYGAGVIITTLVLQFRLVLIARRIRTEVDRRVS